MAISFSGLASGLDTSAWVEALVSVKQEKITTLQKQLVEIQTSKSTLTSTRSTFNSLRTALEKITDTKFGGTFNLFDKNIAKSANEEIFTATADSSAVKQDYDIAVQQLATYTTATSKDCASAVADENTKLSEVGVTSGTFTWWQDGKKYEIDIDADMTFNELTNSWDEQSEFMAGCPYINGNGKLEWDTQASVATWGATTDTSNFATVLGLKYKTGGTAEVESSKVLYKANESEKLTSADAGFKSQITEGTFKIGGAEFTIDENTTLSSLISEINNSAEAQVTASWDNSTGKLKLTSKIEGQSYINIEAGTSNFTSVMGLTDNTGKLYSNTQTLGKNAKFTINGTSYESTSNTISSDISRLQGVTLNLKRVSKSEDGQTKLSVSQDSADLISAVKSFVSAYNSMVEKVDEVTAAGADLHGETSLTSLKNTLRSYATGSNSTNGGALRLLAQIGISTGKADSGDLSTSNTLEFDEAAFKKALEEDPQSVEALLAGENGVLNMMENTVEMSLKTSVGFFDVKQGTLDSDISRMEDKITKQQKKVETYRGQLERKFSNMELIISQMQQNYSSFLSG